MLDHQRTGFDLKRFGGKRNKEGKCIPVGFNRMVTDPLDVGQIVAKKLMQTS
jgi:hypothetical protein